MDRCGKVIFFGPEMKQKHTAIRLYATETARERDGGRQMMKVSKKLLKVLFLILMAGILAFSTVSSFAEGTASGTEETKEEADELYAVVKYTSFGRINLRSGPSANTEKVGVVEPGTKAKVLKNLGKWAMIDIDGLVGYMSTFYLDFYLNGKPLELPPVVQEEQTKEKKQTAYYAQQDEHRAGYYDKYSWTIVENTQMYVSTANGKSLNLRYQPTTDSARAGAYAQGTPVTVLNRSGTWAYVNVNGRTGFMMLKHLSDVPPVTPTPTPVTPIGKATVVHPRGSYVNLRSSRTTDTNSNILAKVPSGTVVDLLVYDRWYSTISYNGIVGYMVSSYLVR